MDGKEITVWVDASSVATGVALETNGTAIEGACCLRLTNNAQHINLAELDAPLKGANVALQLEVTVLHLVTDSACMHQWISDTLTGKAREHEGSWQDASQATARNLAIAGERIWADHRRETREVLSELCR